MEQKMALVHQRLALLDSESDKDADVTPAATSVRPFSLSSSQILVQKKKKARLRFYQSLQ
jgi:hypothetical protein